MNRAFFDDFISNKKFSYIARVVKVYPEKMRADIQPFYKEIENDEVKQPPVVTNIAIQHGNFNGYSILWCPREGDLVNCSCLSHENDTVLADREVRNLESLRYQNINDSIITGTVRTDDQELEYNGENLEIRKGVTKIIIKENEVYIETGTVKIKGNVDIEGDINLKGDIKTPSVTSYNSHKHNGVQSGTSITGNPQ